VDEQRTRVVDHPFVARAARWGVVAWSAIGLGVLIWAVYRFIIFPIRVVFPPLVLALIIVFLLNPIVSRFQRRGMPRWVGALITYLVFLGVVTLVLWFSIPVFAAQVEGFVDSLPQLLQRAQGTFADFADRLGFDVGAGAGGEEAVIGFLGGLVSFTRGLFHAALVMILGPILAFYLLVDLPKIRRGIEAMIPARRRPEVEHVAGDVGRALGGFFRGQMLVALFVGVASSLGLWIVGLPYWALIGMITGLFNLIPLIGPFIGMALAAFVAFTGDAGGAGGLLNLGPGWALAFGSAIALAIVQQIDNHVISPNIVARTVKLHPVTVMLALLAGGTLLGLWGMLLAVPTVATVKVLLLHAWDTKATWPPPGETDPEPPTVPRETDMSAEGARRAPAPAMAGWLRRLMRRPPKRQQEPASAPREPVSRP